MSDRDWWRQRAGPPTQWTCRLTVVFGFYVFYCASCPTQFGLYGIIGAMGCAFPIWLGLGVTYLFRLFTTLWMIRTQSDGLDEHLPTRVRFSRAWFHLPIMLILIFSTVVYPWPLVVRFGLSRSAFELAAMEVHDGRFAGPRWIGLYYMDTNELDLAGYLLPRGVIRFDSVYHAAPDESGFLYDPISVLPKPSSFKLAPSWRTVVE